MSFLTEPVVIEVLLSLVVTALIWFAVRRLLEIARRLDQRRALREFIRGMDHYLRGEHEQAAEELARVLERDPENVEARIAFGDALRELGRAAQAHREHYHVQSVFGHDLPRNELSLGRDLLALDDPGAAIPVLERALRAGPQDGRGYAELRDALQAVDRYEEAVGVARTVLERATDDAAREDARRVLGRVLTLAGAADLARGDTKRTASRLEEAIRIAPELVQPRMELVRAKLLTGGPRDGERAFASALGEMRRLAEAGTVVFEPLVEGPAPTSAADPRSDPDAGPHEETPRLPGGGGTRLLPAARGSDERRPVVVEPERMPVPVVREGEGLRAPALPEDGLAPEDVGPLLAAAARAYCEDCGRAARDWTERCPGCGAYGTMRPRITARLMPIENPRDALAEIEESPRYVRMLCGRIAEGREDALAPLARVGRRAVPILFREALAATDPRLLVSCLARMGPEVVPSLLEAWRRTRSVLTRRVFGEKARRRDADDIVACILERMGHRAEAVIRDLLDRPEPEVRLLALDALLRLRRLDLVEEARLLFGARDFVDRLNGLAPEVVRDIVEGAAPDSHLVRTVFLDRTFRHDRALVAALVRAQDREKIIAILEARGFSSEVVTGLLAHADEPALREILVRLLDGYGSAATDHLITAFVDPDLDPATREELARLIMRAGTVDLEKLLDGAADRPGAVGESVIAMVVALGDDVVNDLGRLYVSGGWLGKIGLGREKIQARRRILIESIVRIGTEAAQMALREIRMRETDPGLRREADDALGRLEDR